MSEVETKEEVVETPKEVVKHSLAGALGLFGDEDVNVESAKTSDKNDEEKTEVVDKEEVAFDEKPAQEEPEKEELKLSAKDLRVKKKEKVRAEDIVKEEPKPEEKPKEEAKEPAEKKDDFSEFAPKERKTLELLQFGEEKKIADKGTAKKLAEFYKSREDFKKRLKEDNIDDDEYSVESDPKFRKWMTQNKPPVDVDTLEDIRQEKLISAAEDRAYERIKKENEAKEAERAKYMQELDKDRKRPSVEKEVESFSDEVLSVMPEEVTSLLKGGKDWSAVEEDSPLAAPIVKEVINEYSDKAEVLVSMNEGVIDYDPSNPMHKQLRGFISTQADILKRMDPSKTTKKNGSRFVHPSEFKGEPGTWTLGKAEILKMLKKEASITAKNRIEKEEARIKAYNKKMGYTKPEQNNPTEEDGSPSIKSSPTSSSSPGSGGKKRGLFDYLQ